MNIPAGFEIADEFNMDSSSLKTLTANTKNQVIATRTSPVKIYLDKVTFRVVDAGSDKIFFSLKRNGLAIANIIRLPGVRFDYTSDYSIDAWVEAGVIDLIGDNDDAAADIRVTGFLHGFILRHIKKPLDLLAVQG